MTTFQVFLVLETFLNSSEAKRKNGSTHNSKDKELFFLLASSVAIINTFDHNF